MLGQRLEQPKQRTRIVGVARGDQQGGAVGAALAEELASDDQEARGVVGAIFDFMGEQPEAVDFGGSGATRDCRGAALIARAPCALGIARHGDALDLRQVLVQPTAALRQRLSMGAHPFDVGHVAHAAHQVVTDAQLHLAAYLQGRAQNISSV